MKLPTPKLLTVDDVHKSALAYRTDKMQNKSGREKGEGERGGGGGFMLLAPGCGIIVERALKERAT